MAAVRRHCPGVRVARAWRGDDLPGLRGWLAAAGPVDVVLLDAAAGGHFGGTGATLDWPAVRAALDEYGASLPPVILAGGLTPENVGGAVDAVRPWGVDAAGGCEVPGQKGVKDAARVAAFVAAARAAGGPGG